MHAKFGRARSDKPPSRAGAMRLAQRLSIWRPPAGPSADCSWLTNLLTSGEAIALLSLCANHAASITRGSKHTISYMPRGRPDAAGHELVPLSEVPFEYEVAQLIETKAGKAIVAREKGNPKRLIVAFAGLRPRGATEQEGELGPQADRKAFANQKPEAPKWLKSGGSRVHSGVLSHHNSIWNGGLASLLTSMRFEKERGRNAVEPARPRFGQYAARDRGDRRVGAVSYTHLTLPTILLV